MHSGGHFDGVDTLKTRLLPWLGTCFSVSRPSVTNDTRLQLIQVTKIVLTMSGAEFNENNSIITYGPPPISVLIIVHNICLQMLLNFVEQQKYWKWSLVEYFSKWTCLHLHYITTYIVCGSQESVEKDRKLRELSASHDNQMQKMDAELGSTRLQLDSVKTAWV